MSDREIEDCSYQRKNNIIRYPAHIDDIIEYNYVMYKNNNYGNKWFYAFVTNMEYINDNLTNISIETDCFQTWQFDLRNRDCFVEREHVNNDSIGANTIDENLNVGEVIQESETEDASLSEFTWLAVSSSYNPANEEQFSGFTLYNNQIFGDEIHIFNMNPVSNLRNFLLYLLKTNADKHIADIKDVFIVPSSLIDQSTIFQNKGSFNDEDFSFYTLPYSTTPRIFSQNISKQTSFSDFIPKNNKCFVYPYNYLYVTNNIGNFNIFKYEDFSGSNATFEIQLAMSIGCSGRLVPKNYKRKQQDDDEALPLAKYPTCGWSADSYVNWLTQNAVNLPTQIFGSLLGSSQNIISSSENPKTITGNAGTAQNLIGAVGNIFTNVISTIGQFYSASLLPNIGQSQNTGDVNYSAKRNTFTFRKMRAKTEYLKAIDDFFSMYGYKVNSVKQPNITGRQNWNYVKTIGCNITGNIPPEDLQVIRNMFDNGVTFWHNPNTFLDYDASNNIV